MRTYTPERLALAKRVRDQRLKDKTEIYAACNCTYPIDTYRNTHSHDSECAAVPIIMAKKAARAADREESRYR